MSCIEATFSVSKMLLPHKWKKAPNLRSSALEQSVPYSIPLSCSLPMYFLALSHKYEEQLCPLFKIQPLFASVREDKRDALGSFLKVSRIRSHSEGSNTKWWRKEANRKLTFWLLIFMWQGTEGAQRVEFHLRCEHWKARPRRHVYL